MSKLFLSLSVFFYLLIFSLHADCMYSDTSCCNSEAPCCSNDSPMHFTIGADWLYWNVKETNIGIGAFIRETRNSIDPDVDWDPALVAKPLDFDFKWSSGFRIYAGGDFCCGDWTVTAVYANIHSSSLVSHQQPPGINSPLDFQGVALATNRFTFLSALPSPIVDNISVDWCAHVSYLDFDVARNLSFNCSFRLSPHIGMRVLWIHQKYNFEGSIYATETDFENYLKEKTIGYGLEGGLWGSYDLPYGFSLKGHLGGAILYSQFHTTINFFSVSPIVDGTAEEHGSIATDSKLWQPIYDVDFSLALEYSLPIGDFHVAARLGWEQHLLFGASQFAFPSTDLSMQGLTLGLNVAY